MSLAKWVGVALGTMFGGFYGGVIGFILGSAIDGFSKEEVKTFKRRTRRDYSSKAGRFEVSLLILSAYVIKSDGEVSEKELTYVRGYFTSMYGREKADQLFKVFNKVIQQQKVSARQVAMEVNQYLSHPSRLQLMHYLFGIANADGKIAPSELAFLQKLASYFRISSLDFESIKATFTQPTDQAYKILEVSKSDSNQTIKKAYRSMAKKYHPDRVAGMGEPYVTEAKKRFQKIQDAYVKIKKDKGL